MGAKKCIDLCLRISNCLRVLKLEDLHGEMDLPSEIGSVVHLRFLSLRGSYNITGLPSSLSNLICLRTPDFRFHWSDSLGKIIQTPWITAQFYLLKLSTLHNLQTLSGISGYSFDFSHLTKLTSLRKLDMEARDDDSFTLTSTSTMLTHIWSLRLQCVYKPGELKQLVLSCRNVYKLMLWGPIDDLPTDLLQFPNLTMLWLSRSDLMADQMAMLEKIPNLRSLRLNSAFAYDRGSTMVSVNEIVCR